MGKFWTTSLLLLGKFEDLNLTLPFNKGGGGEFLATCLIWMQDS